MARLGDLLKRIISATSSWGYYVAFISDVLGEMISDIWSTKSSV